VTAHDAQLGEVERDFVQVEGAADLGGERVGASVADTKGSIFTALKPCSRTQVSIVRRHAMMSRGSGLTMPKKRPGQRAQVSATHAASVPQSPASATPTASISATRSSGFVPSRRAGSWP